MFKFTKRNEYRMIERHIADCVVNVSCVHIIQKHVVYISIISSTDYFIRFIYLIETFAIGEEYINSLNNILVLLQVAHFSNFYGVFVDADT